MEGSAREEQEGACYLRNLSASHKREYVEWIAEAKRDETRAKRLATAIEWMAEGKVKEWRYIRK
jgi:uncharacterized protein YdeI (YjbR/CyaY-like superfamily)